jgi:predicted transcriptional regulator
MKLTKDLVKILGLTDYEVTILKALKEKELIIQDLAVYTDIPRTSLYYALPHLVDRGFIESFRRNKKTYWRNTYKETIDDLFEKHKLDEDEKETGDTSNTEDNFIKKISPKTKVYFYNGKNQAVNVFRDIEKLPPHSRFYGIQPEASIVGAITENRLEDIIEFNKKVKSSKLIVEGIIHERGTESMVQSLSPSDKKRLLDSFSGRSADTSKLPEGFLNDTKAEIYFYDDKKIAIVNWYEDFAIIIENKDVFDLLIEMFKSTKYMLKKYDQNEKIARKLVELG